MKLRLILSLCLCLAFGLSACSHSSGSTSAAAPNPTSSCTYYVDSVSGDDSSSGASSSSPWKTLSKVGSASLPAGSVVCLLSGDTWYEELDVPSSNLTIDAYGSGAAPVIDGSMAISSSWTSLGSGLYSQNVIYAAPQAFANITENGTMLTPIAWNTNTTTTFSGAATGTFSYSISGNTTTIYIRPAANPASNTYRVSSYLYGVHAFNLSNITIQNISVTRFSLNGIGFQNCQNCSVNNATVTNGGGVFIFNNPAAPPNYIYAGNGIEYDTNSSGGSVNGVTISNIFDSGISPQTYANNQSSSGITFSNSTIDRCGFAGVEISILSNGGSTGSSISNITVTGMTITNSGHGWSGRRYGNEGEGIRVIADAGAGTMNNISLQKSTVSGSAGDGIRLGGEIGAVTLNRLSVSNNAGYGISATTNTSATSLLLNLTSSLIYNNTGYGINFTMPSALGFNIFQNTFFNNGAINFAVFGQAGTAKMENNIFFSTTAMTHVFVNTTLSGNIIVNNNCYNNQTNMFGYNGTAYSTVTAVTSALGVETNGYGGAGVNMTNPSGGDFTLQSTSACRGLGNTSTGVSLDYRGAAFAATPSSGAFEYP